MKAAVLEAIKKSAAVPSMPQVVSRFLEITQDPAFKYEDLVKVLSVDAGTVSEVLRLANSALFGVRHKVVSLKHALTLLGPKRTRSLLLGRYLVDAISQKVFKGLDMSYFWRRSLTSSLVAANFAGRLDARYRDEASIGALLADIGVPILYEAFPEEYGPIATEFRPKGAHVSITREQKAVGVTHAEVSAMIMAHWSLPEFVSRAVNLHQSKDPGEGDVARIARILNASDRLAKLLCEETPEEQVPTVCQEATAFIGTDVATLAAMLPTIESEIEDLAAALRIDVIQGNVYAVINRTVEEQLSAARPA